MLVQESRQRLVVSNQFEPMTVADVDILGGGIYVRGKFEATPTIHLATPISRSLRGVFVFLPRCGDDFRS